jgi:hypothetical protein
MSGKRQHIIPRFLLKGFAFSDSKKKKDKPKIWVYDKRRDSPFRSTNENIAVEKEFYTYGDNEADTVITAHESKWAKLVSSLRAGDTSALTSPDIPIMLWHLEVRSKAFREELSLAAQKMVSAISDRILNGDVSELVAVCMKHEEISKYIAIIEKLVSKFGIQCVAREMGFTSTHIDRISSSRDLLYFFFKDYFVPTLRQDEAWRLRVKNSEDFLNIIIPQASKKGHIQGLFRAHSRPFEADISFYDCLEYEVLKMEDNSVILGDSIIMRVTKDRKYDKRLTSIDKMIAVALPLSFNQILVGHPAKVKVNIDLPALKKAVAGSSEYFFVGALESDEDRRLHEIIGTEPNLISNDELDTIIQDIWT